MERFDSAHLHQTMQRAARAAFCILGGAAPIAEPRVRRRHPTNGRMPEDAWSETKGRAIGGPSAARTRISRRKREIRASNRHLHQTQEWRPPSGADFLFAPEGRLSPKFLAHIKSRQARGPALTQDKIERRYFRQDPKPVAARQEWTCTLAPPILIRRRPGIRRCCGCADH